MYTCKYGGVPDASGFSCLQEELWLRRYRDAGRQMPLLAYPNRSTYERKQTDSHKHRSYVSKNYSQDKRTAPVCAGSSHTARKIHSQTQTTGPRVAPSSLSLSVHTHPHAPTRRYTAAHPQRGVSFPAPASGVRTHTDPVQEITHRERDACRYTLWRVQSFALRDGRDTGLEVVEEQMRLLKVV